MDIMLPSAIEQQATVFVERNIRPIANTNRLACGDGRYLDTQSQGAMRIFGEDMGALPALWKVGNFATPADCVRAYREAKIKVLKGFGVDDPHGTLFLHTDSHGQESGEYGCGHMKHMANGAHATEYSVKGEEMEQLFQAAMRQEHVVVTPLAGGHTEQMVILVHGADGNLPTHTVRSTDPETGDMNFVVDLDRVMDYFNRLAGALHMKNVTGEALQDAYLKHQTITAGILAPNYPVVDAFIDATGKAIVKYSGVRVTPVV